MIKFYAALRIRRRQSHTRVSWGTRRIGGQNTPRIEETLPDRFSRRRLGHPSLKMSVESSARVSVQLPTTGS